MRRYTVSQVRERLAEALDEADKGESVVIERKGVRYSLKVERPTSRRRRRKPIVTWMDPAVAAGQWTWDWSPGRLRFRDTRRKKK